MIQGRRSWVPFRGESDGSEKIHDFVWMEGKFCLKTKPTCEQEKKRSDEPWFGGLMKIVPESRQVSEGPC